MSLAPKQRWTLYGIALAATLAAIVWTNGPTNGAEVAEPVGTTRDTTVASAPHAEATAGHGGSAAGGDTLRLERLQRSSGTAPTVDPFGPRSWQQMDADERRADEPPPPPPRPQAPPLPYSYMGKMIEAGGTVVFLRTGDRNYIARVGDTLDGVWRVERIGEQAMVFDYVPLKQKQNLSFSSGGEPAAAPARDAVTHTGGEESPEE